MNSANLGNWTSMNWDQLKDLVSHICLTDAVVASWSLVEETAGLL